ncbi:hypothetical protein M3Y99_01678000 [Aphelenchoides fujianensis]|nr:hypothetical protein M3Y99_01678000 [Aphelenchoides fujianensis]
MHVLKPHESEENQSSDKIYVLVFDITGVLWFVVDNAKKIRRDLRELLHGQPRDPFNLELVAASISRHGCEEEGRAVRLRGHHGCLYDRLYQPMKFFAAFYVVNKDFSIDLWSRLQFSFAPTFTQLRVKNEELNWVVCGQGGNSVVFKIVDDSSVEPNMRVQAAENKVQNFPAFVFSKKFGAALLLDELEADGLHYSVVGLRERMGGRDGRRESRIRLPASGSSGESSCFDCRKGLKFNTGISALKFIEYVPEEGIFTLVSPTAGPACIWVLRFTIEDGLTLDPAKPTARIGKSRLGGRRWSRRRHDHDRNQILFYPLREVFSYADVLPACSINIGAPCTQIVPLETDEKLLVLTAKGLQQYDFVYEEAEDDPSSSSSPKSSILTLNDL